MFQWRVRIQQWISMGLRGKVVRRVGFPLHMKLQSTRSYNCVRGLNEESGSEGWISDIFTGGCRLSAVRPLLVSLYSTVTDRNWRRKKNSWFQFFFFLLWISAIVHHRQSCVDSWWKTRALFVCAVFPHILMCCSSRQQSQLASSAQPATKRCHRYITFPTLFCFTFHS